MLIRYRLTANARKRQFYEGLTPSLNQMVELTASGLDRAAEKRLRDIGRVVSEASGSMPLVMELPGEYDALTLTELLQHLHDEETGAHRLVKDRAMYQVPPPRNY